MRTGQVFGARIALLVADGGIICTRHLLCAEREKGGERGAGVSARDQHEHVDVATKQSRCQSMAWTKSA
jgi:hypothetical protein